MILSFLFQLKKICLISTFLMISNIETVLDKGVILEPKEFTETVQITGASDYTYYSLSNEERTTIEVIGPGTLSVYNRVQLEEDVLKSQSYFLKYIIDGAKVQTKKINSKLHSNNVSYKNKELNSKPSKAHKEVIRIPPGKHSISFYKSNVDQNVHVRFKFDKTKKQNWKEIKSYGLQKVQLQEVSSKKKVSYSRIDHTKSFNFSTSRNNSKIRVFFRADFDYKMYNQSIIRFTLKNQSGEFRNYKLTVEKSNRVENLTDKELVPGKLEKIYIDIPVNQNEKYELSIKDSKNSALVRVFLNDSKSINL